MIYNFIESHTKAQLFIGNELILEKYLIEKKLNTYTFIRTTEAPLTLLIDRVQVTIPPKKLIPLTPNQYIQYSKNDTPAIVYQFNSDFYCIKDHDKEVNCMGVLFFSNTVNPMISLNQGHIDTFDSIHKDLIEEITTTDSIQAEMLRILIKNFIIRSTRLLKKQQAVPNDNHPKQDLLKNFNMLVEEYFKSEHQVSFYADKLFKSPKTLSNNFSLLETSPLQIIQQRIILETKRLINYSDNSFKEIAFQLGYSDASQLSKLFKKNVGISPRDFKKEAIGKN